LSENKLLKSRAKTASGENQAITGFLDTEVSFNKIKNPMRLYIIPSIKQKLILGHYFWRTFQIAPNIISSLQTPKEISELSGENLYPLTAAQGQQLAVAKQLFPKASDGLGRTSLIEHTIEVGNALPVKQRFYPVSPSVEKLLYAEIDRMLQLDVIEPSVSPWSSPMRLVVKPNKIRLCLDERRLNQATKKDAYPLPSID